MTYREVKSFWINNLRTECQKRGIGVTKLAALLDVDKQSISGIFNGRRPVSTKNLYNACLAIRTNPAEVLNLNHEKFRLFH
jgi:transcriptional regulator with XRE-family HTH domain